MNCWLGLQFGYCLSANAVGAALRRHVRWVICRQGGVHISYLVVTEMPFERSVGKDTRSTDHGFKHATQDTAVTVQSYCPLPLNMPFSKLAMPL